jgi:hypothetical protein
MKIADYFLGIERSLRRIKGAKITGKITSLASNDFNGLLRCRVLFWDESYLDIYEVVSTELGYPVKVHYAYTYIADEKYMFRYDNAPHHPEIKTYPHLKHVEERDQPSAVEEPTLSQILSEIRRVLKEE